MEDETQNSKAANENESKTFLVESRVTWSGSSVTNEVVSLEGSIDFNVDTPIADEKVCFP